jgi:hypothetical protein
VRKQYNSRPGERGLDAWDVDSLIRASADLPVTEVALGRVMDGMHRIARAILDGRASVRVVRFVIDPEPDFRDCSPDDLPYD